MSMDVDPPWSGQGSLGVKLALRVARFAAHLSDDAVFNRNITSLSCRTRAIHNSRVTNDEVLHRIFFKKCLKDSSVHATNDDRALLTGGA